MNGISDRVIEDIKSRIDLADLISSYGISVKHSGATQKACCPFHTEKTPSFNINVAKGFYHCFGCGESGDVISFVMKYEALDFMSAVRKLAGICGVKIEEREDPDAVRRKRLFALMAEVSQFYHRCLAKMREAQAARDYLIQRDLGGQVQEDFLIGYAPNGAAAMLKWAEKNGYSPEEMEAAGIIKASSGAGDPGFHRFGGRLMFTIRDRQGRVVAFSGRQLVERKNSGKYVNSPDTLIFKKSNVLFGFDRAAANIARSSHREAIVCEGQIDTIRLHMSGFPVAVAAQGTAFTEEHARMLKRVADAVVLVFDDDAAGHKATVRTAAMLLAAELPVRVVSLPGGDDPDSFLRKKGAAAFQALLDSAESIVSFQCRLEKSKERDPKSIDAVSRISKAVISTIVECPGAVLRAAMADEAARLLGLPTAALMDGLESALSTARQKPRSVAMRAAGALEADVALPEYGAFEQPIEGEDARAIEPPPLCEMALMEFMLSNEHDIELDAMFGELLPQQVFRDGFTWRFMEAWRTGVASGEDAMGSFAAGLPIGEAKWFEDIVLNIGRSDADQRLPIEVAKEYVKSIWIAHLERRRGELPVDGDREADERRIVLSAALKKMKLGSWQEVKDIIRKLMKGEM